MRKLFLKKIEKMLTDEKDDILQRVKMHNNLDIDIHGDETDEIQGKILALTTAQLVARNKERIQKIDIALAKISDGSFGVCEECGEEIAEKRLLVNPGFITCIVCAEKMEILSKRHRA